MPSRHDFLGLLVSRLRQHYNRVSWGQDLRFSPGETAVLVELLADADGTDSAYATGTTQLNLMLTAGQRPLAGRVEGLEVELGAARLGDQLYNLIIRDGLGMNGKTIKVQAEPDGWRLDYTWAEQEVRAVQLTCAYWINLAAGMPTAAEEE